MNAVAIVGPNGIGNLLLIKSIVGRFLSGSVLEYVEVGYYEPDPN